MDQGDLLCSALRMEDAPRLFHFGSGLLDSRNLRVMYENCA